MGDQGAVAFLAEPVRPVLGVPPVDAGEVVEVLGHLPRPDGEVHQVVPAPRIGNHRGRTHIPTPAAGTGYCTDGVPVGGAVGGVLFIARLAVSDVEGLGVGGRIRGETVVLGMLHEGVLSRPVHPMRPDVVRHSEEGEVSVGTPPDPRTRLQGGYRHPPAEQVPGGGESGRAGPHYDHVDLRRGTGARKKGKRRKSGSADDETASGQSGGWNHGMEPHWRGMTGKVMCEGWASSWRMVWVAGCRSSGTACGRARVRITVESRVVAARDLHADPVAGEEDVARGPEVDPVLVDLAG